MWGGREMEWSSLFCMGFPLPGRPRGLPGGGDTDSGECLQRKKSFFLCAHSDLPLTTSSCGSGPLLWEASLTPGELGSCAACHSLTTSPLVFVGLWGFSPTWCSSRAKMNLLHLCWARGPNGVGINGCMSLSLLLWQMWVGRPR